jgi:hypothetical protein
MLQARSAGAGKVRIRPHPLAAVYLSRETLLVITSAQLEHRIQRLKEQRPLTALELEEVGRQRRQVKNREQARLSRLRKKRQLRDLDEENQELRQENWRLRQQLQHVNELLAVAQGQSPLLAGAPVSGPSSQTTNYSSKEKQQIHLNEVNECDFFMDI